MNKCPGNNDHHPRWTSHLPWSDSGPNGPCTCDHQPKCRRRIHGGHCQQNLQHMTSRQPTCTRWKYLKTCWKYFRNAETDFKKCWNYFKNVVPSKIKNKLNHWRALALNARRPEKCHKPCFPGFVPGFCSLMWGTPIRVSENPKLPVFSWKKMTEQSRAVCNLAICTPAIHKPDNDEG